MFELLGGFVVKFLPDGARDELRELLSNLTFDRIDLDGSQIDDKRSLHTALYHAMNFSEFWSGPTDNWDSLADLLWQWAMGVTGREVTKVAFVIDRASTLLSRDPELVFQFAETCTHLETIVRQARDGSGVPALLVRVFLIG